MSDRLRTELLDTADSTPVRQLLAAAEAAVHEIDVRNERGRAFVRDSPASGGSPSEITLSPATEPRL